MRTHLSKWVVSLLIIFVSLFYFAPHAHAQAYTVNDSPETYKPLHSLDTGSLPALHQLMDIDIAPAPDYTFKTQSDGSVVLSAVDTSYNQPTTVTTYISNDRIYRLKLFATGAMLIASGVIGLVITRGKPVRFEAV
jgi:hypothetical protein